MDSSQPLVTAVIPFYNCQYVNQAIESILSQTYKNIEIILVNDGSTKYNDLITPYLSKIFYIEQKNMGVASALNQGIKNANGDFLVWLSSDDLFDEKKIETQLCFMLENKSIISFTNFNIIDENNRITKFNVGRNFTNNLEILQTIRNHNPINGCTVMMSKNLVKAIGYFNESLKYAQDYDYWIRAALHFPVHYLKMTLTNYRVHNEMGSILHNKDQMKEFYKVREKYRLAIDNLIVKKKNGAETDV
ncbi:glycosyltransferase [Bacillus sp. J33]|uniref:glycosyltransferase n=1 Tax=Bacillus sp. J33 TaxID=935836 RepID=UPI00047B0CCB|nr:glycosyltransferase [Bacillus sp. J33]